MTEMRLPLSGRLGFRTWVGVDCAAGVLLATISGEVAAGPVSGGLASLIAVLSVLAVALLLGARRLWPRAVLAVLLAGLVLQAALTPAKHWAFSFGLAFVLYMVAVKSPPRQAVAALISSMVVWTIAGYLVLTQNVTGAAGPVGIVQMIVTASPGDLVLAAGWVIGVAVGQQRVYADGLRQQAERRAQERILAERLRIAGELHDIVAHSMSLITVQAGVARYVVADRSGEAAQALASIEQTSRDALNEMRRLLGVLRGADGRREDPELGPAPRLADLDGLAAATMRTGLTVRVRRDGAHRELPAGVELAGYRVVQEALTNVIKHAAARKVDVLATYGPDELRIEIVDDGRGTPRRSSQGHGLIGLRERVTSYGGEFTAGPAPDAGFRVVATIPILPLAPDRSDLVAELVTS